MTRSCTRLTIRTRAIADGANASSQGGTALLEQRLTTLLLEAVPSAVKTEVITVRALTTVGILFLLHTRYQPAGQAEKASILQFLVSPDAPKDTQQAVKNLRRWLRWLARSTELQLAPPDASLLVKAVDKLGAAFLSDPSAVFRVQAFRLQNSIDHLPSQDSSVSLAQLYLAELETLLLVAPDPKKQRVAALEAPAADKPEEPKGKGKGKEKGGKPNEGVEKEVCRQFSSEKGCPRGNTCKYVHQTHTGMSGRCFNCGGKHLKSECTSPGCYAAAKAKADAKKAVRRTQADKPSPGAGEAQSQESEAAGSTLGPSAAQAIRDAASSLRQELLKAIRSAEPGNQVSGALSSNGKGLIDGGATCCLRSAKNTFEWNESTPTSIRLAVGEVTARVSPAGTLLLPPGSSCDPIVALHELIRIGYRMTFLSVNKMRIWRPGQPDLPLDCSTGCPEITPNEANRLITEIENSKRVNRAQVARLTQLPTSSFEDVLQDPSGDKLALWFKGIVPSVPVRLWPTLAVAPCKKAAPWNRRRRRTLSRAKHLIIHLFPCKSRGLFRSLTQANLGWDVLEVDIEEDLLREDTFGFLLHLAQTGRVRAVTGGPPCRTFSALHHLSSGRAATQAMVDQDSALYLRMFMLTSVARRAGRALRRSESPDLTGPEPFCFGMEQPEDPAQVFDASHDTEGRPYPSCFRWSAFEEWSQAEGPTLLSLDQGPLGHAKRKPTTLALLGPGWALQPVRGPGQAPSSGSVGSSSLTTSTTWGKWAPGLCQAVVDFVGFQASLLRDCPSPRTQSRSGSSASGSEDETSRQGPLCAAMTKAQEAQWAQHLAQDHMPRRRDCFHCLAGEFTHKPHRRIPVPQAYTLGLDLIGPLVVGDSEDGKRIRWGLVGVYAFPKIVTPEMPKPSAEPSDPRGDYDPARAPAPEAASSSSVAVPSIDTSSQEPAAGSAPPELLDSEPYFADLFGDEGDGSEDMLPVLDAPADPEDLCDPLTPSQTEAADAENKAWQQQFDALRDEWEDSPLPAVPMQDIPFFVPLVSKSGKGVAAAVMQVVTQVRALGLPLHRIHSDRGLEFRNASLAQFTRFHRIPHTATCGDDFKANGRTENTVRLLKRATRTLLQAHAAPTSDWSFAMRHVTARLRAAALSALGQPSPKLLPWRARLVLRRRTWSRLAAGSWGSRALMVTVLCPSPDVPGGHLVVTDDGGYLHSDVLVEVGEAVELREFAGRPPPTRLRDKQPDIRPSIAVQRRGGGCEDGFSSVFSSLVPEQPPTVHSCPGGRVQVSPEQPPTSHSCPGDRAQVLPEQPPTVHSCPGDRAQVSPGPGDRAQVLPEQPPTVHSCPGDRAQVSPGPGDRAQVSPEPPPTVHSCPGDRAQARGLEARLSLWTPVQDVPPRVAMVTNRPRTPGYDVHDRGSQDEDIYYAYVTAEQASILNAQFPDFDNFVCGNLSLYWEKVEPVYPPSPNEHEQVLWDQRFRDWIQDPELRFVVAEDPEDAFEERPSSRRGDDRPAATSSERDPPAERSRSRSPRDQHRETPDESEEYLALTVRSCRASGRAALYSFVTPQDGDMVFWLVFDLHTVISDRGGLPHSFRVAALSTEPGFGGVPTLSAPESVEGSSCQESEPPPQSQSSAAPAPFFSKGRKKVTFLLPEEEDELRRVPQTTPVLDVASSEALALALLSRPVLTAEAVLGLMQISGLRILQSRRARSFVGEAPVYQTFGHYCSPYDTGLTRFTRQRPELTRVLCRVLVEAHPTATFSALAVIGNCQQSCHHDLLNEKGALNYLFPLSSFKGRDLWIEDASVSKEEAVHRFIPSPKGQELRKGKIVPVRPALAFDARRFHEVQEFQGERWMLVGYTPRRLDALPETDRVTLSSLGFPLPPCRREPVYAPSVCALFHDWVPFAMPSEPASVYECVAASVALDKCRESVLKAYDFVQYNLKKLGRQARHLWGHANDTGNGEEVAELVRSIDHQVCSLERVLDRASSDTAEAPPLLPDAAEKELACFFDEEEETPPPQLCVARAVDPSAATSTERSLNASPEDSNVPLQTRTVTLVEVLSELELWLPSWKEEYSSLVHQHKAVRPLTQQEVDKWKREGVEYQLITRPHS